MSENLKGRIVFLDYMRVFAFMSVMIGHKFYDDLIWMASSPEVHITLRALAQMLMPLCLGGAAGVVVFFLTSGYIITKVLAKEEPKEFLVKRVFRIYPLYMIAVVAEYLAGYWGYGLYPASTKEVISRLLLVGDFNGTPNGLHGVEWTLRIEVLFYAFMAVLKYAGFFRTCRHLPAVYVVALAGLYLSSPFPGAWTWTFAYVTVYAPLLIFGSLIMLAESHQAIRAKCIGLMTIIFVMFLIMSAKLVSGWKESNYMAFGVMFFLGFWALRTKVAPNFAVSFLAELTFSVYLMHNWVWIYIDMALSYFEVGTQFRQVQILIILFLICYGLNRYVEKTFNRIGAKLAKRRPAAPIGEASTV